MRHDIVARLLEEGALAVVRMADADGLLRVVEALRMGGLSAIEITMTTTDAFRVIERVSTEAPGALVGVGSVLDGETARRAIDAGARYVVSPILDAEVIATAHRYDVPALPGAFTPTEIQHAHTLGADVVKVFPRATSERATFGPSARRCRISSSCPLAASHSPTRATGFGLEPVPSVSAPRFSTGRQSRRRTTTKSPKTLARSGIAS